MKWIVRDYVGNDWPLIKSDGIELECAGATRVQAEAIAVRLNAHDDLVKAAQDVLDLNEKLKRVVSVPIAESETLYDALAAAVAMAGAA